MKALRLEVDELRTVIRQTGFRVKTLAIHLGMDRRTLERCFAKQLHITPKTWIVRERMNFATPLLAEGFSNKEIAACLSYSYESNFCRDFKRHFGCAPQEFGRIQRSAFDLSPFDKQLSRFDKAAELSSHRAAQNMAPCS